MSVNAIGSMNTVAASGISTKLTDATRKKLEALGIDTSKIKTEMDGLQKLKEAQAAQGAQAGQAVQSQQQSITSQIDKITDQVRRLAEELGIKIGNNDQLSDVLSNINTRIFQLAVEAGQDPQKLEIVKQYQDELTLIGSECASLQMQQQSQQSQQHQLTGSLDNLANYNKILHKL